MDFATLASAIDCDVLARYTEHGAPDAPFRLSPWGIAWACYYWSDADSDPDASFKFPNGWCDSSQDGSFALPPFLVCQTQNPPFL